MPVRSQQDWLSTVIDEFALNVSGTDAEVLLLRVQEAMIHPLRSVMDMLDPESMKPNDKLWARIRRAQDLNDMELWLTSFTEDFEKIKAFPEEPFTIIEHVTKDMKLLPDILSGEASK